MPTLTRESANHERKRIEPETKGAIRLTIWLRNSFDAVRMGGTLKARALRGGIWLGGGSFAEQTIRFGRNMVLTRILAPAAFGTMAIVVSAAAIFHTIAEIGVREAVIQNPRGAEDKYVGASWWMGFGRGLSIVATLCLLAPFIAKFYQNPELAPLFRVISLGVLFDGIMSARVHVFIKQMKFKRWAIINHGGAIIGVMITVILSFYIRDVWALVIGYCSESAGRCLLSYILCPYMPPLKWDRDAVRELLGFSKSLFGLSILNLIFARTDIFVLGKLRPAAELGIYTMAVYLIQTPTSFVMNILGQTILPTFSQIQDDNARINRILLQVSSALALVATPALVFLFFCAPSLLTIAYGHRYNSASAPLMVAAIVAFFNLLNGQITSVFFAKGSPHLHRRCVAIMAASMIVLVYPGVRYLGLVGGQLACLAAIVTGFIFQLLRVQQITQLNISRYAAALLYPAAISAAIFGACIFVRLLIASSNPLSNVIIGLIGCLLAYGIAGLMLYQRRQLV